MAKCRHNLIYEPSLDSKKASACPVQAYGVFFLLCPKKSPPPPPALWRGRAHLRPTFGLGGCCGLRTEELRCTADLAGWRPGFQCRLEHRRGRGGEERERGGVSLQTKTIDICLQILMGGKYLPAEALAKYKIGKIRGSLCSRKIIEESQGVLFWEYYWTNPSQMLKNRGHTH